MTDKKIDDKYRSAIAVAEAALTFDNVDEEVRQRLERRLSRFKRELFKLDAPKIMTDNECRMVLETSQKLLEGVIKPLRGY
ncbi:hypothetical protein [Herbiconiux daphne]|uniref:Uncharacterized protein n=1 Tax=Herbiconiux daphne TaxID=2970914 RepID=A0ABT2HC70_9MICO|nr:hypothetical protein [Herbiconiux daphne]MCS5737536.1 hypothetical protein [Herbiconiux daphne]